MKNRWCALWVWLMDHTGEGRLNYYIIRVAERVTPNNY